MRIIKSASGKRTMKLSKKEWEGIGKEAGWDFEGTPSQALQDMADNHGIDDRKVDQEKQLKKKKKKKKLPNQKTVIKGLT